jgi:hypothetical protein
VEVLGVYEKVGLKQPAYNQYEELLRTQSDITQLISAGYFDVIQIHRLVLQVFTQRCQLYAYFEQITQLTACRLARHIFNHLATA